MSTTRTTQLLETNRDKYTGFQTNIESDHRYIHEGKGFSALVEVGTITAAYKISFTTPETLYVHWRPALLVSSAAYVDYKMYGGDADITAGTAQAIINRNRNSSETSAITDFKKNTTTTPSGTVVDLDGFGSAGSPTARAGGSSDSTHELVLKRDTAYTILLTPSAETSVNLKLFWYEEDEG